MPGALFRDGLLLVASVGGPLFLTMLVAGLVLGILQAATQVNDPAVSFLPRVAVGGAVLWLAGGWMLERLSGFLARSILKMAGGM
ncbi:MAG TPA: flagellar biosynthetic protein FliQ [Anaeromyxobacteraceae bacterium]|nr:flagellar biosynthetic protein FliQ [Anaeromyxobacteraceae bacterium]